jgi:UDP-N-acetylglucosamine transferase subunit ALG13
VIFAALGTHEQPMDRLVRALDSVAQSDLNEAIVIQSASFHYRPKLCQPRGIMSPTDLDDTMRRASVVITHGGPGMIMAALALGLRPIVVPRDPRFGEHVDAHQMRFARWLKERRPIHVVLDVVDLPTTIAEVRALGRTEASHHGPDQEVIDRLAQIIG